MRNKIFHIKRPLVPLLVVMGFLLPAVMTDPYHQHIFIHIFIWIILTLGIRLIILAGHLHAGHAGFVGMGAYGAALLTLKLGWSFWLALPLGGAIAALLALAIGYPTFRIKGAYFVMVTFATTEVFRLIWMRWSSLTGGANGLNAIPRPDTISIFGFTVEFIGKLPFYYLALILLLITVLVMHRIDASRIGLTLRSIPQADILSESVGINIMRYKLMAFVIASFFAGIGGAFLAHYLTYTSPWDYTWQGSLSMLMYAVIGGTATVLGPVVGCFVLIGIEELLRPFREYVPILHGLILILVLIFLPGGLISIPEHIRSMITGSSKNEI